MKNIFRAALISGLLGGIVTLAFWTVWSLYRPVPFSESLTFGKLTIPLIHSNRLWSDSVGMFLILAVMDFALVISFRLSELLKSRKLDPNFDLRPFKWVSIPSFGSAGVVGILKGINSGFLNSFLPCFMAILFLNIIAFLLVLAIYFHRKAFKKEIGQES